MKKLARVIRNNVIRAALLADDHEDEPVVRIRRIRRVLPAARITPGREQNRPATRGLPARPQEYSIGWGKPPSEHSWKRGQSGNSRGRPKDCKNEATILKDILRRKITVPIGGHAKKITILEAILYRIASDAVAGKIRSADFLLRRLRLAATADSSSPDLSEDDQALLQAYALRLNDEATED